VSIIAGTPSDDPAPADSPVAAAAG
jgi:hypothetical protein